jgi:hypothetical protein
MHPSGPPAATKTNGNRDHDCNCNCDEETNRRARCNNATYPRPCSLDLGLACSGGSPLPSPLPAVGSVSSRMTHDRADRQEDTSRLSHPPTSVALCSSTAIDGLERCLPCMLVGFMHLVPRSSSCGCGVRHKLARQAHVSTLAALRDTQHLCRLCKASR